MGDLLQSYDQCDRQVSAKCFMAQACYLVPAYTCMSAATHLSLYSVASSSSLWIKKLHRTSRTHMPVRALTWSILSKCHASHATYIPMVYA